MFQAIIYERVEVIEGKVVGRFNIGHARDCKTEFGIRKSGIVNGVCMGCFICDKHEGKEATPPGGYIYEDAYRMVCHAPGKLGPLGTLFIESKRHFRIMLK
jgi:hypothetical protein